MTIPSASVSVHVTVTLMFHSLLTSLARSKYLSLFSFSLIFILLSARTAKSIRHVFFFLLIITRPVLARIRCFVCISEYQRILCVSFSRTDSGLYMYNLVVWLNFNLLHNSKWISFSARFYQVLYCCGLLGVRKKHGRRESRWNKCIE